MRPCNVPPMIVSLPFGVHELAILDGTRLSPGPSDCRLLYTNSWDVVMTSNGLKAYPSPQSLSLRGESLPVAEKARVQATSEY